MNINYTRSRLIFAYFPLLCLLLGYCFTPVNAATWVPIQGEVRLADGTPICAMVLANGQYVFSCDGSGSYRLNVPLDENGQITVFAFADGFAPFSVTGRYGSIPARLQMQRAIPGSPSISVAMTCQTQGSNWVRVKGQVRSGNNGSPICSMVLANGQHMFSCDASLGSYDLTVPSDQEGNITLFAFADGFQPYSRKFSHTNCVSDTKPQVELLIGTWDFKYQIISIFEERYSLSGPAVESPNGSGKYYLFGEDRWGDQVVAMWDASLKTYALLDQSSIIDRFYTFDLTGPSNVVGCYYQVTKSTGNFSRCYTMTGNRISAASNSFEFDSITGLQSNERQQYEIEWTMIEEDSLIETWSPSANYNNPNDQNASSNSLLEQKSYDALNDALDGIAPSFLEN